MKATSGLSRLVLDNKQSAAFNGAKEVALSKGIPSSLLNRKFVNAVLSSTDEDVSIKDLHVKSDDFIFATGLRFSLPNDIFKKYKFLTDKQYASMIPDDIFEDYLYYVISALYSRNTQYEFLEDELARIEAEINKYGTFTGSTKTFSSILTSGTLSEHLIYSFYSELKKTNIDYEELYKIVSIATHIPAVASLQARTAYIAPPSMKYMKEWDKFTEATGELIRIVHSLYNSLNKDYWKAFTFLTNNDLFEIANIFNISDIDEQAVDNWTHIPYSVVGSHNNKLTLDSLNYLKWTDISRY